MLSFLVPLPMLAATACRDGHNAPCDAASESIGCNAGCAESQGTVDLLLVVDTSADSGEVHLLLQNELPWFLGRLMVGDSSTALRPLTDMQVGVITADLRVNDVVPGCDVGDQGALQTATVGDGSSCAAAYPAYHTVRPGDDYEGIANAVACVAFGLDGCPIEQPLASLEAAIEARADVNRGFFRTEAALAVLIVSKEDDCSVADPALFTEDGPYTGDSLDARCVQYPDALQPVTNYVHDLIETRPAQRIAFALLAGVPPELEQMSVSELATHDALQPMLDPAAPSGIRESCVGEDVGAAFPPHRLLAVAAGLKSEGAHAAVGSVCGDSGSYRASLDRFARAISHSAYAPCPE